MGDASPAVRRERAHAKLNLVLRILAREASGFHGIETLFQQLALHDEVRVSVGEGPSTLTCEGPSMPAGGLGRAEDNLAWRAAALYADAAAWKTTWQIAITKHIPVGGGLGGGSADAAAVLRAMESLCPTPLGLPRLLELGGQLGADVPFLVSNEALAWAWGRGDRLLPLPALPAMAVSLVAFRDGVNTGAAYGAFANARAANGVAVGAFAYAAAAFSSWSQVAKAAINDFEQVVPALHPGVAAVLPSVRSAAHGLQLAGHDAIGLMSGSGATCFVLHPPGTTVALALPAGARLVTTTTMGAATA